MLCFSVAAVNIFVPSHFLFNVQVPSSHNTHSPMLLDYLATQSLLPCNHFVYGASATFVPSSFCMTCIVIVYSIHHITSHDIVDFPEKQV